MAKRILAGLILVALAPLALQAGEANKPAVVVRVRSLDTLVDNAKLLITLAGHEEIAKQVEGLIKAKIGVEGLAGIDPARPLGAFVRFGQQIDDIRGAVLIPIADEKAFLALLDSLDVKATKGKNDVYSIKSQAPVELFLRFANRYAYVAALNASILEGKLADPVQILGKDGPTFSATVRLDQLPEAARQLAIPEIERRLQQLGADQKIPGESPAQQALRNAAAKEFVQCVLGVVKDGSEVSLAIDLNAKSKELSASLSLTGKQGTELAQSIQKLGKGESRFGGLRGGNVAFRGLTHIVLPEDLSKSFGKLIDEGAAEALAKIQEPAKRQQAQQLIDVLLPTLKAGELDSCIQLRGPNADQKYTVLAGIKVKNGVKLGNTVSSLLADALKQMPEPQRSLLKVDFASIGTVKVHRLELPADGGPASEMQKILGESAVHVAFRDDAVLIAIGKDSMAALKEAVAGATAGPSQMFLYEVDVARLAPIVAPTEELRASAKKIFQNGQDGMVRLQLEGGASLRFSLSMRLSVVQFLSQVREMKAQN